MLYIIRPTVPLDQHQYGRLYAHLVKQLSEGAQFLILPKECTIELLDTTPAGVMIAQHDAMLGGRPLPTPPAPPTPPATRVLRNGYPVEWDVPLWKRAARALGFLSAETGQVPPVRNPPPAPPMKPKHEGAQPPGGLVSIHRRAGPRKEEVNGEETRLSINAYKMWLLTPGSIEYEKSRCEHHYEVDLSGPERQYVCRYCRDITIQ